MTDKTARTGKEGENNKNGAEVRGRKRLSLSREPEVAANALNGEVKYAGIQSGDKALVSSRHVNSI